MLDKFYLEGIDVRYTTKLQFILEFNIKIRVNYVNKSIFFSLCNIFL